MKTVFRTSSGSDWLSVHPASLRMMLNWLRDRYGPISNGSVPVYITEIGYSDNTGTLDDQDRIEYYKGYLEQLLKGILSSIF